MSPEKESERDNSSNSNNLHDLKEEILDSFDLESDRTRILEKINYLDRRIKKNNDRRRKIEEEIQKIFRDKALSEEIKEIYIRRLVESDKIIHKKFGYKPEATMPREKSSYPSKGVFSVGLILTLLGIFILFPVRLPLTLRLVFGLGTLIVGFTVVAVSILKLRKPLS
jgi:hypothetical protein